MSHRGPKRPALTVLKRRTGSTERPSASSVPAPGQNRAARTLHLIPLQMMLTGTGKAAHFAEPRKARFQMDWIEELTMLKLLLQLIPVLPQVIDAIKAAAAELQGNDPVAVKLKEVATELEAVAAAVEKQLGD